MMAKKAANYFTKEHEKIPIIRSRRIDQMRVFASIVHINWPIIFTARPRSPLFSKRSLHTQVSLYKRDGANSPLTVSSALSLVFLSNLSFA